MRILKLIREHPWKNETERQRGVKPKIHVVGKFDLSAKFASAPSLLSRLSALFVIFMTLIVTGACHPDETPKNKPIATNRDSTVDPSSLVVVVRRPPFQIELSPSEAKQALAEDYQVMPDRRFLLALSSVRALVRGKSPKEKVELRFSGGRWRISMRDAEIGSLSEFPSFQEMYNLLSNFARSECEKQSFKLTGHSSPQMFEEALKAFSPSQLTEAAARGDSLWLAGNRSPEILYGVARASCLLSCQTVDLLAVADGLTGRALSLVALTDATNSGDTLRWRCMLAENMGYISSAEEMARLLNPGDVFAAFMKDDFNRLRALSAVPRNHEAAYLYLRRICQKRDRKAWREWIEKIYPINRSLTLPALRATSEMATNDWMMQIGFALARSSTSELESAPELESYTLKVSDFEWATPFRRYEEGAEWMLNNILAEFESGLKKREGVLYGAADGGGSPLLFGSDNLENFYRSYFYSAVYTLSRCYFNLPSAKTFCTTFADSLKVTEPHQALQLEKWLNDRISVSEREKSYKDLESDLSSFTFLGAPAHLALFEDIGASFQSGEVHALIPAAHVLFDRVDGRPALRTSLSRLAEFSLMDVALSHKLTQAIIAEMPSRSLSDRISRAIGLNDTAEATRLLQDTNLSARERAGLLSVLKLLKAIDTAKLLSELQNVAALSGNQWWAVELYTDNLMQAGRYRASADVLESWLKEMRGSPSLDEIPALVQLARAYTAEGKLERAWDVLSQPHIKTTGRLELLLARSRICLARKDTVKALDWATNAQMLYPDDVSALATRAEMLWRMNRYGDAAELIATKREQLTRRSWSFAVGNSFVQALGHDWTRATLAIGALRDVGIDAPRDLGQIAHAYYMDEMPDMAFNVLAKVRAPTNLWADYYCCAYRYLKAWKGKDAALVWIEKEVPADRQAALAPYAFISGQYELLWRVKSGGDGEMPVLQAAAYLMEDKPDPLHLKAVRLASPKSAPSLDSKLVGYLVDDEQSLLSEKMERKDLGRALFFIGWKELATGSNFIESLGWYRTAVEFGSPEIEEYGWTTTWLSDIVQTLADKPRNWKHAGLEHLRVAMPLTDGRWDARRRFRLVNGAAAKKVMRNL